MKWCFQPVQRFLRLREKVNWEIEDERIELLLELGEYIKEWQIQSLPDVGYIIRPEEIELLLSDSLLLPDGVEFIDFVVCKGYTDEPKRDEDGKLLLRRTTPLHRVLRYNISGREEKVRQLFKIYNKFDMNYAEDSGLTHFHVACFLGFQDIITEFLEVGQDPNCIWQETGESGFHLILEESCSKALVELLLKHGANPNLANAQGLTPLHIICYKYSDNIDLVNMLFVLRYDKYQPVQLDAQDKLGNTPLHVAAHKCCRNLIEFLLRKGADPNVTTTEENVGLTPLHICTMNNSDEDLVQMFFQLCNELNHPPQLNVQDKSGNSPLHWALRLNYTADVSLDDLRFDELNHPLQIDARDKCGKTPLHLALQYRNDIVAEILMIFLLRRGANPNGADALGSTPLHEICNKKKDKGLAKLFFDINDEQKRTLQVIAVDNEGRTPLELAVKHFLPRVVVLLFDHGADTSSLVFPPKSYFDKEY
ncbi:hypothetical protein TKK_0017933 [Trichogramma kaykai]|uniref:Uncharacterized protein n=1 Tax=Trichogramma kaykai TaxID=54128 RepID=A0ABD2W0Y4_9HYME